MSLAPVNPLRPLLWHPVIDALRAVLPPDPPLYLVGGAVRDAFQHLPLHDLDLATPGDGRPVARFLADHFGGAYYTLDAERGVGRALIPWEDQPLTVDVATFRGPDLLADLQHRDFSVNALAVALAGDLQSLIDPLGGLRDLERRQLRQCGPDSIASDPVRALRAVRLSLSHRLLIESGTRQSIRENATRLAVISPERLRDEFFNILEGRKPWAAIAALSQLGLLEHLVPEAAALAGVEQGPPHEFDVWRHTLAAVEHLDQILDLFDPGEQRGSTSSPPLSMIVAASAPVKDQLQAHVRREWPQGRSHRGLLLLAALLHDAGKPSTRSVDDGGRIRFLRHEQIGEKLALERGAALKLSNDEVGRLAAIVGGHMRPHWLHGAPLTARAIYRFWRDTGPAGVDLCLLAMADYLATQGIALDLTAWTGYLRTIQTLLVRYFLHAAEAVSPPALLTGTDLQSQFELQPGPQIGSLLEQLREAQIEGQVSTREEALQWVQRLLNPHQD